MKTPRIPLRLGPRSTLAIAALSAAMLVAVAGTAPAAAQSAPSKPGPAHTAKLFDLLCLSKLPDIDAIAKLASSQGFAPVTGDALKPYQPQVPAETLKVWRFKDLGAGFTLIVAKSKPDAQFKASVPDFAQSTSFACSLIPAAGGARAATVGELTKLIGRKPDENYDQGPLAVESWSAKTDEFLIQAFHYAIKARGTTRLISATMFVKN